jgi:hypothetical protein
MGLVGKPSPGCVAAAEAKRPRRESSRSPDPAEATGTEAEKRFAFADTLRMLTNRINIFVSLPLDKLDQLSLQRQLDMIGKTGDAVAEFAAARSPAAE